jgi:hypothetical protein
MSRTELQKIPHRRLQVIRVDEARANLPKTLILLHVPVHLDVIEAPEARLCLYRVSNPPKTISITLDTPTHEGAEHAYAALLKVSIL